MAIATTDELDTLLEDDENLCVDNAVRPQRSFKEDRKTQGITDNERN